jgi:hypothetical protein
MRNSVTIAVLIAGSALPASAEAPPGRQVQFLTEETSASDPMDIALGFIRRDAPRRGLTPADVSDLAVLSRTVSSHNQTTHINLRQRTGGLEIANANLTINVSGDGRVINMAGRLVPAAAQKVNARSPRLSASAAITAAARGLGLPRTGRLAPLGGVGGTAREQKYANPDLSLDPIPARLVYYAVEPARVRLAWQVLLRTPDQQHWWNLGVDAATGEILDKADWIANDAYKVLAIPLESPSDGKRTLETNPADALASPFGWHDTDGVSGAESTRTLGNSVSAQEDVDANNRGGFRPNGGSALRFDFPFDDTNAPSTYQSASITNLFYWNNVLHDTHYHYGFDEQSGNFQQNNYGRSDHGATDAVQADDQDGSGLNNANFATPPDGVAPRMQMYVWTGADHLVVVNSPTSVAGNYLATGAVFGPSLDFTGITGNVVAAADAAGPAGSTLDACDPLTNPGALSGNIALIRRGGCSFVTKVRNVQGAGAVAAIITNQVSDTPIPMGDDGTGRDIDIPSVMIGLSDGDKIRRALPGVNATVKRNVAPPSRDSSMDNGVITHEYGHGVSNRLTGGPSNVSCLNHAQSGGMGEGWSDFWALALTAKSGNQGQEGTRGLATYLLFEPPDGHGIRTFPYSPSLAINPLTYGDAGGTGGEVHAMGEIWATALWDMYWNLVNEHGFERNFYSATSSAGNIVALQLVMDGLKLQPCSPTFLDARDAILLADQNNNNGANQCLIWSAFAKRGMGVNADDGGNDKSLAVSEDFNLPSQCPAN